MIIRRAIEGDIPKLIELMELIGYISKEKATFRANKFANSNSNGRLILVMEESGELTGYVGLKKTDGDSRAGEFIPTEDYAHLNWTGVNPKLRKKGRGSKLVSSCDEIAKSWGKKGIWLDCREGPIPFYTNNNYRVAGSFEDDGRPRYVMIKDF